MMFVVLRRPPGRLTGPRFGPAVRGLVAGLTATVLIYLVLDVMAGAPLGWLFGLGALVGLAYPLLFGGHRDGAGPELIRGTAHGFLCWIVVVLTVAPLFHGGTPSWSYQGGGRATAHLSAARRRCRTGVQLADQPRALAIRHRPRQRSQELTRSPRRARNRLRRAGRAGRRCGVHRRDSSRRRAAHRGPDRRRPRPRRRSASTSGHRPAHRGLLRGCSAAAVSIWPRDSAGASATASSGGC